MTHAYKSLTLAEILLIENIISIYRSGSDTTMYIVGSSNEVCVFLIFYCLMNILS
jgi:hypothetical protein